MSISIKIILNKLSSCILHSYKIGLICLSYGAVIVTRTAWAVFKYCGTETVPLKMEKKYEKMDLQFISKETNKMRDKNGGVGGMVGGCGGGLGVGWV